MVAKVFDLRKSKLLIGQKGFALIELVPILIIFTILITYSFGFVGVVHRSILSSTASKVSAIKMIQNRSDSNTLYFGQEIGVDYYHNTEFHWHGTAENDEAFIPLSTPITLRYLAPSSDLSNEDTYSYSPYDFVSPDHPSQTRVRLKIGYGYCLNSSCGE